MATSTLYPVIILIRTIVSGHLVSIVFFFFGSLTKDWREAGFKELLLNGGVGRLIGFWAVCCQACFSYTGVENIAITADEVERPRQTVPKAVRRVVNRLNIYYIGAIFVLGLNLSANDPIVGADLLGTPGAVYYGGFALMARRASLPGFAHFLNVMALGAAFSVSNASLYVGVLPRETSINFLEPSLVRACPRRTSAKDLFEEKQL